jgi:hypothetical protein
VTSAGSEFLLWEALDLKDAKEVKEVVQPAKILDLESSSQIKSIDVFEVMKGALLV